METIVNEGNDCTGRGNTGNWNIGDWNTGFFNTITPTIMLFNKPTDLTRDQIARIKGVQVLSWNYENNWWIYSANMSEEEKKAHPEHEYTGGYLKSVSFKEACRIMWDKLTDEEKEEVKKIPNFDADVFSEITGVNV